MAQTIRRSSENGSLSRNGKGNPVSVHHSCPKRRTDTGLREKTNRHRITFEVQELEQLGDGRNLVGFGVGGHLAQGQVILHRPGADDAQGRLTDGRRAEPRWHLPSMATGLSSGGSRGTGVKPRQFITAVIQA